MVVSTTDSILQINAIEISGSTENKYAAYREKFLEELKRKSNKAQIQVPITDPELLHLAFDKAFNCVFSGELIPLKVILDACDETLLSMTSDEHEMGLLNIAAIWESIDIVNTLLEKGADPNKKDENGRLPIRDAADRGFFEVFKVLLDVTRDIHEVDIHGNSLLHESVHNLHYSFETTKALVEKGLDVNLPNSEGNTPLLLAANRDEKTLLLLLENGADIGAKNHKGQSVIHLSSPANIPHIIAHGANLDRADNQGMTALHHCSDIFSVMKGKSPNKCTLEKATALIKNGANLNSEDQDGWTPLHYAVAARHFAFVHTLLDSGAKCWAKTNDGRVPEDILKSNTFKGKDIQHKIEIWGYNGSINRIKRRFRGLKNKHLHTVE